MQNEIYDLPLRQGFGSVTFYLMNSDHLDWYLLEKTAMSLEIRPLAALYTPPPHHQ